MRPNGDANKINPTSTKLVNVALFSGNGFDATTVDPNSIRFGVTGNEATPIHVARRDINADGFRDVVLRFQIQDLGIQCGITSATLTGQVTGGPAIIGSTPIATIGCKEKRVEDRRSDRRMDQIQASRLSDHLIRGGGAEADRRWTDAVVQMAERKTRSGSFVSAHTSGGRPHPSFGRSGQE
jgi:hypothetical protein